jgi:hypothetical protein
LDVRGFAIATISYLPILVSIKARCCERTIFPCLFAAMLSVFAHECDFDMGSKIVSLKPWP